MRWYRYEDMGNVPDLNDGETPGPFKDMLKRLIVRHIRSIRYSSSFVFFTYAIETKIPKLSQKPL